MWKGFKVIDADAHMHEPQYFWERYVEAEVSRPSAESCVYGRHSMVYEPDGKIITKGEPQRHALESEKQAMEQNTARLTGTGGRRRLVSSHGPAWLGYSSLFADG